jgi:hypothetical protein
VVSARGAGEKNKNFDGAGVAWSARAAREKKLEILTARVARGQRAWRGNRKQENLTARVARVQDLVTQDDSAVGAGYLRNCADKNCCAG